MKKTAAISDLLLELCFTTQDRAHLLASLEKVGQMLYIKSATVESILEKVPTNYADLLRHILNQLFSHPSADDLEQAVSLVTASAQKIESIELELAYIPSRSQVQALSETIRAKINPNSILSFSYKPDIIGGVILQNQGKTVDLSLKAALKYV